MSRSHFIDLIDDLNPSACWNYTHRHPTSFWYTFFVENVPNMGPPQQKSHPRVFWHLAPSVRGGPCQQLRRGISEAAAAAGAALADSDVSVSNAALQAMKVSSSWLLGNISNLVNPCKDQQTLYAILLCLHAAPWLVCVTHMICWQHWYFANSGASENVPAWRPSAWRNLVPW